MSSHRAACVSDQLSTLEVRDSHGSELDRPKDDENAKYSIVDLHAKQRGLVKVAYWMAI
jgi:hypothetical protein